MKNIARLIKDNDLRKEHILTTAAITDMSTTQITETIPEVWKSSVIKFGESLRILDQFAIVDKSLVGKPGDKVWFPITTSHLSITTSHTEGEVRTLTELTNLDTVAATITASDFFRGAVRIGKNVASLSAVNLIEQAKYTIAQDLADDVDLALATAMQDTAVTKNIFGGASSNADASDLATGDVMTTDLFVDAMVQIRLDNFVPKTWICGPYQEGILLKDSQFVNASEYGGRQVLAKGEIGEYLNVKVIQVVNANLDYDNTDTDTNDASAWGADGYCCPMIGVSRAGQNIGYAIAWKEMPKVDYEYRKELAAHDIYYDQAFDCIIVQPKAMCLIKVTDS